MSQHVLHTADWHLHLWRECSRDGGYDRLADGLSTVRQILQAASDRNCPVVFGGDMKQIKGQWPVPVLNGLLTLFREFHDVNVFAIPGNHDGRTGDQSGLDALNELPNFHLFDAPTIQSAPWGEGNVAYWPWQPTMDALPDFLAEAKREKVRVLIGHAFLSGATVGADYVVPAGKSAATLEQFGLTGERRIFQYGLFGDVHKYQIVGSPTLGCAVYPGSPYAQNWGEQEVDKGVLLVDVSQQRLSTKLMAITAPRFRVADLTVASSYRAALKGADWRGDFVRVLVRPEAKPSELEQIRERSGARVFQVVVLREPKTERRAAVHAAMTQGELLAEYVKVRPPAEALNATAILEAGRRLLEQ